MRLIPSELTVFGSRVSFLGTSKRWAGFFSMYPLLKEYLKNDRRDATFRTIVFRANPLSESSPSQRRISSRLMELMSGSAAFKWSDVFRKLMNCEISVLYDIRVCSELLRSTLRYRKNFSTICSISKC